MSSHRPRSRTRLLLAGVVVALASTVLAACGSGSSAGDDTAGGATVSTAFGEVKVPANPKRVVALGWGDAETALALGVQPVGASDWLAFGESGVGPWAEDLYDTKPEIIATQEPSYEKIAALEPDVILDVKSSGDTERNDRLSQIAPTVGIPKGAENYLTSMDQQVSLISQALGKVDEGKKILAETDRKFQKAADAHPELAGKTVTVAAYTSEGWGAYVEKNERVQFMERLGLKQNPAVGRLKADGFSAKVSSEELDTLDADLLVVFPIYVKASSVTDQAAYRQISAVKDGHTVLFGDDETDVRNAYALNSVLSTQFAIDNVVPKLSKAVG